MTKWLILLLISACLFSVDGVAQVPRSRHVWIIAEENHSFEDVEASMPFLVSLGQRYGVATQYYADMHNSISALMHLTAGETVTTNDSTSATFNVDNIVRHLVAKGLSFRSYQEGLPEPGFLGLWSGSYVKRHNPLAYFSDVADSSLRYNLVPLTQLASDLANHHTGDFNYVTPNLDDDAHDGSLQTADDWLGQNLPPILAQPEFQTGGDGLLFVVFDEGNLGSNIDFRCNASSSSKDCGGRVFTVVVSPNVKPGFRSGEFYNHESLLATVCAALGTDGCPGKAQDARPMSDFFVAPLSASPGTATVAAGQAAQYSLSVQPVSGFYDTDVSFSCNQLPKGAHCYFSPGTVRPTGSGAGSTLTVAVPAHSAALLSLRRLELQMGLWLCFPGLAFFSAARGKRQWRFILGFVIALAVLLFCLGCGGQPGMATSANSGMASGQLYSFSVTVKSSSASFSLPVKLRVTN